MMQWLCPFSVPTRLWLLDYLYCLILWNSQLQNYIRISYFIYKAGKQVHFSNSMNIFLSYFFQANSIPFLREPEHLAKWKSNSASAINRLDKNLLYCKGCSCLIASACFVSVWFPLSSCQALSLLVLNLHLTACICWYSFWLWTSWWDSLSCCNDSWLHAKKKNNPQTTKQNQLRKGMAPTQVPEKYFFLSCSKELLQAFLRVGV